MRTLHRKKASRYIIAIVGLLACLSLFSECKKEIFADTYLWYDPENNMPLLINYDPNRPNDRFVTIDDFNKAEEDFKANPTDAEKRRKYEAAISSLKDSLKLFFKENPSSKIDRKRFSLTLPEGALVQRYVISIVDINGQYVGQPKGGTIIWRKPEGDVALPDGIFKPTGNGQTDQFEYIAPANITDPVTYKIRISALGFDGELDLEQIANSRNEISLFIFNSLKPTASFTYELDPADAKRRHYIFDGSASGTTQGRLTFRSPIKNWIYTVTQGTSREELGPSEKPVRDYQMPSSGAFTVSLQVINGDGVRSEPETQQIVVP